MPDHDRDELDASKPGAPDSKEAVAKVQERARASGLRPDGGDDKALMDEMWGEAEPPPPPYSPL